MPVCFHFQGFQQTTTTYPNFLSSPPSQTHQIPNPHLPSISQKTQGFLLQYSAIKMKKQFLCNSNDFTNELNCSSIRINAEEEEGETYRRQDKKNNQLTVGPKLKKYEENEIVGFEMSLEISDNGENCLELMRSKSMRDYRRPPPQQKLFVSKRDKQANNNSHTNSLYNTTSFDQMTMNITTNTQKPNSTQMHNNTSENQEEIPAPKMLNRPSELAKFKETSFDEKMTINITKCKDRDAPATEHEEKLKNSNALLEGLKRSTGGDEPSRAFEQPSFQEPYFKVGSAFHITPKTQPQPNKLFIQDHRRQLKKVTSVDASKGEKKLTLRDYMYLSKLSGKNRDKLSQSPTTPQFSKTSLATSRSRRKLVPSNYEVMQNLKKEVVANIELVQGNMSLLLEYIEKSPMDDEITNNQLMKMYNLARILRDKIVNGNDELVVMLQEVKE